MAAVRLSALARSDLAEIWSWIALRSGERVADQKLEVFARRFALLADNPEVGRMRPDIHPDARSLAAER